MKVKLGLLILVLGCALAPFHVAAQTAGTPGELRGEVADPSGAVVPGAQITLHLGAREYATKSGRDGRYAFRELAPGSYTITVTAKGFAPLSLPDVVIAPGQTRELKLPLAIEVEHQEVTVTGQNQGVNISPDQNASAMVIRGKELDALSDDPDELQNELEALAGPAAGPNGGQIYIDGFAGGQLPPKSSILEIRVNQNPFSAQFARIGYGRIEILTKPGSQKLHGSIGGFGSDSAFDTANPLIPNQPAYDLYSFLGNLSGPLTKRSSYFFDMFRMMRQNQNIVDAMNPQNTSQKIYDAYPNPSGVTILNPRVDFQLGKSNTITIRDSYWRTSESGSGVGTLSLPEQASNALYQENSIQLGDTILVNESLANDVHFEWRRIRNQQTASYFTPTVTLQGSFTGGGSSSGVVQDHQDDFELQDDATATAGRHTLRFGADARAYRDANYSTSGSNGTYMFSTLSGYLAAKPALYATTLINNPLVRALVFDGSLYLQDDWKLNPKFMLGLGLRYEGQNWIHDHDDWAPRIALAWSPRQSGVGPAKTVVRAGYGWFYNRFTVPNSFSSFSGTPYVIEVLHDNLVNQRSYTIANPSFYNPNAQEPPGVVTSAPATIPTYHTIDSHFHAALDMQMGIGVDRQLSKAITGNITYLYTQGVHQYFSNNVTAPAFNLATYTVTGATPALYNYQYQSEGIYKQNQIIATLNGRVKHLTINANYTYNTAKSDAEGVNSFLSDAQDPGLDYGRASFSIRHAFDFIASYSAPYGIIVAADIVARSGVPYNLTIGSDLTANNQFNARPAYGNCNDAGVMATRYGCLDPNPKAGERLMPYGAGIGPANSMVWMRFSKVFGIGPRLKTGSSSDLGILNASNSVSERGLSNGGAAIHFDATAPRKYSLTLVASASNVFNQVNLGTPNGVLDSQLFGQTQSLAGGDFGEPTPGNRTIFFQTSFSF